MIKLNFEEPVNKTDMCLNIPKHCEERFLNNIGLGKTDCEEIYLEFYIDKDIDLESIDRFNDWANDLRSFLTPKLNVGGINCIVSFDDVTSYRLTNFFPISFDIIKNNFRIRLNWTHRFNLDEN